MLSLDEVLLSFPVCARLGSARTYFAFGWRSVSPREYSLPPRISPRNSKSSSAVRIYFAEEFTANVVALITVVGVDVETEDGVYFHRLRAAHGGTELPTGQCGH